MKLSISNLAWDPIMNDKVYSILNKYNFCSIEIAPTIWISDNPYNHIDKAIEIANKLNNDFNLDICSMQSICYGKTENIFNSSEEYNELYYYLTLAIDFAAAINCPNLVFGCPKNRIIQHNDQILIALDFFRSLGNYANTKNVVISIEPNPVIYGTNFLNTTFETFEFIKMINSPNILLNIDLGTIIYNEESLEILKSNISLIGHIHISEPYLEIIKHRDLHRQLFNLIKISDYNKSISIEMKKHDLFEIENTVKYISEVFNEIH